MRPRRENCIILDTSILPSRPEMSVIEDFVMKELKLDITQVKCIQPHNVKHVVYVGVQSNEMACNIAAAHHLKHCIEYDDKQFPIPIYVESSAVDVRIHDLPYDMDNAVITEHMRQYGEVITIRNEVWRSYFPGLFNGVRVVRMKIKKPIPSYIIVDDEPTLVSYQSQIKTCRHCGNKFHPKQPCGAVAVTTEAETKDNTSDSSTTNNSETKKRQQNSNDEQTNATNGKQQSAWSSPTTSKQRTGQQNKTMETKRQRSIDTDSIDNGTKKANLNDDSDKGSITVGSSSDICPYTMRPYGMPDLSHIKDPVERQAIIEDNKRRIDAAYREIELEKQRKNRNAHK